MEKNQNNKKENRKKNATENPTISLKVYEWLEQAEKLYTAFSDRCSTVKWENLFAEEIFMSLEYQEQCKHKLMEFLRKHTGFPVSVWKVLDEKLGISRDCLKWKEQFLPQFIDFLMDRCKGGEEMKYTLFAGPEDGDYDNFLLYYHSCRNAVGNGDYIQAEQLVKLADATGITHPYLELMRAKIYQEQQEYEKAEKLFLELAAKYPEEARILAVIAGFYWMSESREKAIPYFESLQRIEEEHYAANACLADWYEEQQDYHKAKACLERICHKGLDKKRKMLLAELNKRLEPEYQRSWQERQDIKAALKLADCYYQAQKLEEAEQLLKELENKAAGAEQIEYMGLCARVYAGQERFQEALKAVRSWQQALEQEPENSREAWRRRRDRQLASRTVIIVCHYLGRSCPAFYQQAVQEYEGMDSAEQQELGIYLELARIFLEKGEPQRSLELAEELIEKHQHPYGYMLQREVYDKAKKFL